LTIGPLLAVSLAGAGGVAAATGGLGQACSSDKDCRRYYRCRGSVCDVPPAMHGHADERTPVAELTSGGVTRGRFFVELAADGYQRMRGLSRRPSMARDWGMLFVFPDDVQHAFTMVQMQFPLDMIFIDGAGKVVDIISDARPGRHRVAPAHPYRFVLELNAGTAHSLGIEPGASLSLTGLRVDRQPAGPQRPPEP
jgi:uncharacterized membrane protein (UPF0127 family)